MWDFYTTPVDILYLVLTFSIGFLTLFLIIALWRLIRILRDINTVTDRTKDTVDLINHYLWQPIKIMTQFIEKTKGVAGSAVKKGAKKARKKQ